MPIVDHAIALPQMIIDEWQKGSRFRNPIPVRVTQTLRSLPEKPGV